MSQWSEPRSTEKLKRAAAIATGPEAPFETRDEDLALELTKYLIAYGFITATLRVGFVWQVSARTPQEKGRVV